MKRYICTKCGTKQKFKDQVVQIKPVGPDKIDRLFAPCVVCHSQQIVKHVLNKVD